MLIFTGLQAVPEILEAVANVRGREAEGEDTMDGTKYQPCQHTRGVGGMRGDVEVQVEGFRVEGGGNALILDGKSKVKEVHGGSARGGFPFEAVKVIQASLETIPSSMVGGGAKDNPDAKHVVDISSEEKEILAKFRKEHLFPNGVKKCCVGRCRRRSHCASFNL